VVLIHGGYSYTSLRLAMVITNSVTA
jgi:hypothetical protein